MPLLTNKLIIISYFVYKVMNVSSMTHNYTNTIITTTATTTNRFSNSKMNDQALKHKIHFSSEYLAVTLGPIALAFSVANAIADCVAGVIVFCVASVTAFCVASVTASV